MNTTQLAIALSAGASVILLLVAVGRFSYLKGYIAGTQSVRRRQVGAQHRRAPRSLR